MRNATAVILALAVASPAFAQRIPRQSARPAAIQGRVIDESGRGIPGVDVELRQRSETGRAVALPGTRRATTVADGVFRFLDLDAGDYGLTLTREGYTPVARNDLRIRRSELVSVELTMTRVGAAETKPTVEPPPPTSYGNLPRPRSAAAAEATPLPPGERVFVPIPDRWNLPMPDWDRYGIRGDYPYVAGKWWDPYNQNILKGDAPVFGSRTFFTFTGVSDSLLEGRNLPTPSGVSTARPDSEPFFGRGGQYSPVTVVRTSFDVFHGDTAFRPIDWRLRVQPAFSLNFINTA